MEFLLPEEVAPITSRGNCTPYPRPLPLLLRLPPTSRETRRTTPFLLSFFHFLAPLPPRPLLPFTLSSRHPLPSLAQRLTFLIPLRIYRRSARSSRDDLSKIGNLTIVDRHPSQRCIQPREFRLENRKRRLLFAYIARKVLWMWKHASFFGLVGICS